MSGFNDIKVRNKLLMLVGLSVAGFLVFGIFTYFTLKTVAVGGPIYGEITNAKEAYADLVPPALSLARNELIAHKLVMEKDPAKVQALIGRAREFREMYEEAHEKAQQTQSGKLKELLAEARPIGLRWLEMRDKELVPMVLRNERQKAEELLLGVMGQDYAAQDKIVLEAVKIAEENAKTEEETAASVIFWRTFYLEIFIVAALALISFVGWLTTRSIVVPLAQVVEKLKAIALGDTKQQLDYRSGDEIGALADAFRSLTEYVSQVGAAVEALGRGDLSVSVAARSAQDSLAHSLAKTLGSLKKLTGQTNDLIAAAQQGRLSARGDAMQFDGAYRDLIAGINQMMDAIVTPLGEAGDCLQRISANDLTAEMTGRYEGDFDQIKQSLNKALLNLRESMNHVLNGAVQVASAANQISAGSASLASGASEQASTLEEVASSIQEISSMSKNNAANARDAKALSDKARETAEAGVASMTKLSEAVERIKSSSDATSKIVKTIEEIAFQTNLLALNAAVEAARAGDAGKGFAVVAEEVRNLAMRSAEAAKQTASLIEESVKNTGAGVEYNREVLENLEAINDQSQKVSAVIAEIAAASEQQTSGVEQISVAVEQMNGVTQQAAANSEESASAAEELSAQSKEMLKMIGNFKLSENGAVDRISSPGGRVPKPKSAARPRPAPTHSAFDVRAGKSRATTVPAAELIPFDAFDEEALREF